MSSRTIPRTEPGRQSQTGDRQLHEISACEKTLPSWPFTCLFALFPVWWILGLVDVVIIPIALIMAMYLRRASSTRAPRWFGLWLLFLAFMLCSVIQLDRGKQYLTFGYRAALYLSVTAILLYVYNARRSLTQRRVLGQLAIYWLAVVAGGYLGVLNPTGSLQTPMYRVLSSAAPGLLGNDLVYLMVVRPLSQYSPDGYFKIPPRPSAPFLYTNEWGNVYSLLIPLVIVLIIKMSRGQKLKPALTALLLLSAVPAILTLNRGMMLGLAIAIIYVALRIAVSGRLKGILLLGLVMLVGFALWSTPAIQDRLATRTGVSTASRSSLYEQAIHAASASPFLGYGVPVPSDGQWDPPVGTQGQFWMVLVSHGVPALICFVGFFLALFIGTVKERDVVGIACNTVLLVGIVELFYYGFVPYGLPLLMAVAGLAARGRDPDVWSVSPSAGTPQ